MATEVCNRAVPLGNPHLFKYFKQIGYQLKCNSCTARNLTPLTFTLVNISRRFLHTYWSKSYFLLKNTHFYVTFSHKLQKFSLDTFSIFFFKYCQHNKTKLYVPILAALQESCVMISMFYPSLSPTNYSFKMSCNSTLERVSIYLDYKYGRQSFPYI